MMKLLSQKEEIDDVLESTSNKKAAWPHGAVVCMIMFLLFVTPYFTYFYDKRLLRDQRTESVRQPLHNLRKMSRISGKSNFWLCVLSTQLTSHRLSRRMKCAVHHSQCSSDGGHVRLTLIQASVELGTCLLQCFLPTIPFTFSQNQPKFLDNAGQYPLKTTRSGVKGTNSPIPPSHFPGCVCPWRISRTMSDLDG